MALRDWLGWLALGLVVPACGDDASGGDGEGGGTTASSEDGGATMSTSGTSAMSATVAGSETADEGSDDLLDTSAEGECPPCVPPPSDDCVGMGPCGCGPYECEGLFDGDPGETVAQVACPACDCQVVVGATDVFVRDDVGISRVALGGGDLTPVFSGMGAGAFEPRDFIAVNDGLVIAEPSGLTVVGNDGAPMGALGMFDEPTGITTRGGFVFFGRSGEGALYRVEDSPLGGGPGELVGGMDAGMPFGDVVGLDTTVVFTAGGDVHAVLDALEAVPGETLTLAAGASAALTVDSLAVEGDGVVFLRADGSIASVPLAGGDTTTVAEVAATSLALQAGVVYFTEENAVRRVAVGGGDPEVHAAFGLQTSPSIASNDDELFWVACDAEADVTTSTLRRIPL